MSSKISQRDLAEKYEVSASQVAKHCRDENWVEARKRYNDRVYRKSLKTQEKKDVAQLNKIKSAADHMGNVIDSVVRNTEQMATAGNITIEYAQLIKSMTSAMKDLTDVIRNVYDIPTIKSKTAMDIAWERVELQRERNEIAKARSGYDDAAGESTGGVIMLAPIDEDIEVDEILLGEDGEDV